MANLPENQIMWVAFVGETRRVEIRYKGVGDYVFKTGEKPKTPYVVYDQEEHIEYVVGVADLFHNPRDANIEAMKLAQEYGVDTTEEREENPVDESDDGEEDGDEDEEESDEYDEEDEEEEDD